MIELRDIRPADKEMIRQWRNLPEVRKYMYTDHHISVEEHARWFQRALNDPSNRYWIIVSNEEAVGLVSIYDMDERNKRCYWGRYIASTDHRGKGIGTYIEFQILRYVFEELELNKLCTEVFAFNELVLSMHKRFGFVQEGLFREHIFKGGSFYDVIALSILRRDWEAKRSEIENLLRLKGLL